MSSQTRIDQYFKCTSSNKSIIDSAKQQTVKKVLNRSNSSRKLSLNNGFGMSQNFGNSSLATRADEKKSWQPRNSSSEISTQDVKFLESSIRRQSVMSIGKSSSNSSTSEDRLSNEKSVATDDSVSAVDKITPPKKTIRGFVMACNSPPANHSPRKISLKRRNQESPGMSRSLKKSQVYNENIGEPSETHSTEIINPFGISKSHKSNISCENLAQGFNPENVEVAAKNSTNFYVRELNIEANGRKLKNCDRDLENRDNAIETRENELNVARKNIVDDNQSNFNEIKMKVTPKKRKIRDSSSSRNSASSSGWKVSVSMETPDRSMTALSNDWQRTLEESKDLAKSSLNCAQEALKENVQVFLENERNNESLSEKLISTRENDCNAYTKKTSPRRTLFSTKNLAKSVHFEEDSDCASLSAMNVENAVVSLRNGAKTSSQGILRSNNLRTNGNINSIEKINEDSMLVKKIVDPLKILSEKNESLSLTMNVNESNERNDANLSMKANEIVNLSMKGNEIVNLSTKGNETANLSTKDNETANLSTKDNETANLLTKGIEIVNLSTKGNETANLSTKDNETANLSIKSIEIVNLSTNGNETANWSTKGNETANLSTKGFEIVNLSTKGIETTNLSTKDNGAANSSTKVNRTANSPTKVKRTANSPIKVIETSNSPRKVTGAANSPTKITGAANSSTKVIGPSNSLSKLNETLNSPTKSHELSATPTKSSSTGRKSSFSPRVKYSPQKAHKERVDTHLATRAVENLNQAKQGIIPLNNFDLEEIYTKKSFEFEYGSLNTNTAIKYEARDVQVPEEKHADHFFMVLVNVFSEPLNCGYFDENELDTIFSTLTLNPDAQSLLARMLKRKRGWHRVNSIKYPEIADDLKPIFKELVKQGFLDDDIENEDISRRLSLLQADEIRAVCQALKVNHKGTKSKMINNLAKFSNRKNSLFPGMKSPSSGLIEKVNFVLGSCIRLPDRIENLLDRIFILLIPTQDPKENMADAFRMLIQVYFGEKRFPVTPKERFPIFRNRLHLICYAKARSAWNQIINAYEAKDWETVRALGQLAYDHLKPHFENHDNCDDANLSTLPSHVRRFEANYAWVKVMSKSVEGFKKTKESMEIAARFLHILVSPSNKITGNRTRWYSELAMIESYHRKNFEISADITIEALMQEKLSEIDAAEMLERARKLAKSKALSTHTKERINVAVRLRQEMFISTSEPTIKEIQATMVSGNVTGSKSTWSMNIGGADTGYVRVEDVALRHYLGEGFRNGVHCEGALPVTIFATLLWDEIYTLFVPGAFVSSYQDAPLDLYTSHFLEPRRERIEDKLKLIRRLDLDSLSNIMHEDFLKYRHYESLIHGNLFDDPDDFKDFIECLGMDAVIGICERLAGNYNQWKSGFPDLALWNPVTKKCKIVEVKGPGDSLSTKQRLWIQFLECLGVEVEVCVVKGTTRRYAT